MATSSEQVSKILAALQEVPYYSVRISPTRAIGSLSMSDCKQVVKENSVRLRGWDFPHYDPNGVHVGESFIFSFVDWHQHFELWRMYQSRQFVYLGASWDTFGDYQEQNRRAFERTIVPHESVRESVLGLMGLIGIIYTVTEFYLFAGRLADKCDYRDNVRLEIALHNVENWALVSGDPSFLWVGFYQSHVKTIRLPVAEPGDLLTEAEASAAARRGLAELFSRFGWDNSLGAIERYQKQLIEKRFAF